MTPTTDAGEALLDNDAIGQFRTWIGETGIKGEAELFEETLAEARAQGAAAERERVRAAVDRIPTRGMWRKYVLAILSEPSEVGE